MSDYLKSAGVAARAAGAVGRGTSALLQGLKSRGLAKAENAALQAAKGGLAHMHPEAAAAVQGLAPTAYQGVKQIVQGAGATARKGWSNVANEERIGKARSAYENLRALRPELPNVHGVNAAHAVDTAYRTAAPAAAQALAKAPQAGPVDWGNAALGAGTMMGLGAAGFAGVRGLRDAGEQETRLQDTMANRQHDLDAPLAPMQVTASYDAFALGKLAADPHAPGGLFPQTVGAGQSAIANGLVRQFVERPIEGMGRLIEKKLYTKPKQHAAFDHVTAHDPILKRTMAENPDVLHSAFHTMKEFGPSLAVDRNAVQSFLRNAVLTGGNLDYATIRNLAETEKFVQHSRGQGKGT